MAGWTNRGKKLHGNYVFDRAESLPSNFYVALCTSATAPTADINTMADLTQIATGNGYVDGGVSLTPNTTDFDVSTEDDTNDKAFIQIKDVVLNASGGSIPASGNGGRYAVLTDDNGTAVSARRVLHYWDLGNDKTASSGSSITISNLQIDWAES